MPQVVFHPEVFFERNCLVVECTSLQTESELIKILILAFALLAATIPRKLESNNIRAGIEIAHDGCSKIGWLPK